MGRKRETVEEKVTGQYGGDEGSGNFQLQLCRKWWPIETNESAKPDTQTAAAEGGPEGLFFHSNPQGAIRQKSIDR